MTRHQGRCRSCDAPVIWVETEAKADKPGRRMPLDANPGNPGKALVVADGNLVRTSARTGDGTYIVRYVGTGQGSYRSHFATCPAASKHRNPGGTNP